MTDEFYEIIGFSDLDNNSESVVIIIAADLSEEEINSDKFTIHRLSNEIVVNFNNGEQIHKGRPESNNQFNWKYAQIASLNNDLLLSYSKKFDIL